MYIRWKNKKKQIARITLVIKNKKYNINIVDEEVRMVSKETIVEDVEKIKKSKKDQYHT